MKHMQRYQSGASLMEVLIAMSISLVVTAAMIALMSKSLGTTARIVKMTMLADDLRITMQVMGRDLRRSSYNAHSFYCYANDDCDSDGSELTLAGNLDFVDANDDGFDDDNCFTFLMDRDHDGNSTEDDAGGFRLVADPDTNIDVIEMWAGAAAPDCAAAAGSAGWVPITDPEVVEVTGFGINDDLSYEAVIQTDAAGNPTFTQVVRKLRLSLQGRLVLDPNIEREVEDVISVRNDLLVSS